MNKFIIFIIVCTFLSGKTAYAQDVITLDDAIRIGLQQNYGILIAENQAEIVRVSRSLGNAGFLPRLDLSASREEIFESERTRAEGESTVTEDTEVSLLSGDVELGWTLFDGAKMFVTYQKLGELRDLGEVQARVQVENTITDIIEVYYSVVRQEKLYRMLQNNVEISEDRYNIARTKQELGSGTEFELLLAQSDLNSDRAALMRQEVAITEVKSNLIQILDLDVDSEFSIVESIIMQAMPGYDDLYQNFLDSNRQMEAARLRTSVSEFELKELRRERFPQIDLSAGYSYNREEISNNLFLLERTDGFYAGLTARINLFNGFNRNNQVQIAKINHRNEQIREAEIMKALELALQNEYLRYNSALELVDLEIENLQLAESALEIALEQFRLASITSIELRETQNILFNIENRLIDAQYEAKLSETELFRLSGMLGNNF